MKKIVFLIFFSLVLVPGVSLAVSEQLAPEVNQLCWREADCKIARKDAVGDTAVKTNGWVTGVDPCNKTGWGMCLPAVASKTTIAFGGKQQFENIGDFIKYNYNLALGIAGILAAIMMAVAGIQWTTSGGNSEMISSAKKRIGGSIIGLLIAYLSYTILNTVNPNLVNLTLPQTWMINTVKMAPEMCRDSEAESFMIASKKGVVLSPEQITEAFKTPNYDKTEKDKFECGDNYFPIQSGPQTCMGGFCPNKGENCMSITLNSNNEYVSNIPSCSKHELVISVKINPSITGVFRDQFSWWTSYLESDWLDDSVDIYGVCEKYSDGSTYVVPSVSFNSKSSVVKGPKKNSFQEYYIIVDGLNEAGGEKDFCTITRYNSPSVFGKVKGYVLRAELNPTSLFLGGFDRGFYITPSYTGRWKSISNNGFIPVDSVKSGLYIKAVIDNSEAEGLVDNSSLTPSGDPANKP